MANFERAIGPLLEREGGNRVVEHPSDPGGTTKYGISKRAHPEEDIPNLTEHRARELYKTHYWDRIEGDQIDDQVIAEQLFDASVLHGVRTASRMAQTVVGAVADGWIGQQSLIAINLMSREDFVLRYTLMRAVRFIEICNRRAESRVFLHGWLARILRLIGAQV